jgi:proline iminopeptidase
VSGRFLLATGMTVVFTAGGAVAGPQLANGSFTAELNGFSIHYEVHGDGPVLMTLPNSWGFTWQGLRALYRPLEAYFTLVYFDPRGMGLSGPIRQDSDMGMGAIRDDFDALRRHLGLERVNAIGWSNGAINLILLASARPATLSSAIFVSGAARETPDDAKAFQAAHPDLMKSFARFQRAMSAQPMSGTQADALVKRFDIDDAFPSMWADPTVARATLKEMYAETGFSWRHMKFEEKELESFDFRDRLAEVTARTLVVAGAHDLIPVERVREISEGIKGARFVVFAHSGHFSPVEERKAFVATVRGFLGGQ